MKCACRYHQSFWGKATLDKSYLVLRVWVVWMVWVRVRLPLAVALWVRVLPMPLWVVLPLWVPGVWVPGVWVLQVLRVLGFCHIHVPVHIREKHVTNLDDPDIMIHPLNTIRTLSITVHPDSMYIVQDQKYLWCYDHCSCRLRSCSNGCWSFITR
jgi:hypothetical protein